MGGKEDGKKVNSVKEKGYEDVSSVLLWVELVEGEDDSPALGTEWCESIVGRQRAARRVG